LKKSGKADDSASDNPRRSVLVAALLILVVLLSASSVLLAGASFFPQQTPDVTITTTIYTTVTSWTTSIVWSTVTQVVEGVLTTVKYTTSTSTVTGAVRPPTNLGKTDIGATNNVFSGGDLKAYKYTLGEAGTVQSITVYIQSYGSGARIRVGIYNDNSNYPGSLIAGNEEWTVAATGWKTITLSTPVYFPAGSYWISLLVEKTPARTVTLKSIAGVGTQRYIGTSYDSLPSTFPRGAVASCCSDSLYFTYI